MKLFVRREVNLNDLENKPPDLSEFTPLQGLWISVKIWWRTGALYKSLHEKSVNKELLLRRQRIDDVKEVYVMKLNKKLKETNSKKVQMCIDRRHIDIIDDVLASTEFLAYKVTRVYENPDILLCFPDMPLLFTFEVR